MYLELEPLAGCVLEVKVWLDSRGVLSSVGLVHDCISTVRPRPRHYLEEVWKPNFRQNGQMEKQEWEERKRKTIEKFREEKELEERRCRCEKSRKVAIHSVFPMICGSGGSKKQAR